MAFFDGQISEFSCPICFENYSEVDPKSLPKCGHSLCVVCVQKMKQNSKLLCPNCRQENVIPIVLPTNYALKNAAEAYGKHHPLSVRLSCSNCRRPSSELWECVDCDLLSALCSGCALRNHKNHELKEQIQSSEDLFAIASAPANRQQISRNISVSPKILLIGGCKNPQNIQMYCPKEVSINKLLDGKLKDERSCHVAGVIGKKVLVCGGQKGQRSDSTIFLDLNTQLWYYGPKMTVKRSGATGLVHGGRFYMFGGDRKKSSEMFYPEIDTWIPIAPAPPSLPMTEACSVSLDNKIFVLGINSVLVFDPVNGSWLDGSNPSMRCQRVGASAAVFNSGIIVTGGQNWFGKALISSEMYDPRSESWISICPMLQPRYEHELVVCDGRLFAMGGENLKSVEEYEARMNKWLKAEPLLDDVWQSAAVVL